MEVDDAIKLAKAYIKEVYAKDEIQEVLLEEVEIDDDDTWLITIGFLKAVDRDNRKPENQFWGGSGLQLDGRSYKTVRINGGRVKSVTSHPVELKGY